VALPGIKTQKQSSYVIATKFPGMACKISRAHGSMARNQCGLDFISFSYYILFVIASEVYSLEIFW